MEENASRKVSNFNNPKRHLQSWYVLGKSSQVKINKPKNFQVLGRNLVCWRDENNSLHLLDSRCPHLGADLGKGRVVTGNIVCPYHKWQFSPTGNCVFAPRTESLPERSVRVYPVQEKWGLIWFWNGPEIGFAIPEISHPYRHLKMPSRTFPCHPHVVIANGLDITHFETLHQISLREYKSEQNPYSAKVTIGGQFSTFLMNSLAGTQDQDFVVSITAIGGNNALIEAESPIKFSVIFTTLPIETGCKIQALLFLPKKIFPDFFRAFISLYRLLMDDRIILENINFSPSFVDSDNAFKEYVNLVNTMPTW